MELCIVEVNVSSRYGIVQVEPCSVQFTEILGIFTHESYSKPAICLPEYGLSKTQLKYQVELIKLQDEDETSLVSEELKSSFFS